jgi:nitroreductase
VTGDAPSTAQLLALIELASTTADHAALRPWRLIELRGEARSRLGAAFVEASGLDSTGPDSAAAERLGAKPLRAPLLIAIVVCHRESFKVPDWEQDAAANGVAHILNLLLDDAGWGVMWRTGGLVNAEPVRRLHKLADNEQLLGWLYVGGMPEPSGTEKPRAEIRPEDFLSTL